MSGPAKKRKKRKKKKKERREEIDKAKDALISWLFFGNVLSFFALGFGLWDDGIFRGFSGLRWDMDEGEKGKCGHVKWFGFPLLKRRRVQSPILSCSVWVLISIRASLFFFFENFSSPSSLACPDLFLIPVLFC